MLTEVLGEVRWGAGFSLEAFFIVCRTTGVACLVLLWTGGVALAMEAFRFTSGAFFFDVVPCFFKGLAFALLLVDLDEPDTRLVGTVLCLEDLFAVGILKARKNVFQRFIPYLFTNCNCVVTGVCRSSSRT